ncbi:MAG: glycosyltransferase family 8 protein [Lachnospiraceae bacterium]|nr:glycosyltransferase family 8 protein [Lachnospiraceae bacterium]
MKERINLAFVTDDGYFRQTVVAMTSVIRSLREERALRIFWIDVGISEENLAFLKELSGEWRADICLEILKTDQDTAGDLKVHGHVSRAAYAKMYLPELIPGDWVIYLDGDVICLEDIGGLLEQADPAYSLCAAEDRGYRYENEVLGLPPDAPTFNSGVMLLNLAKMRRDGAGDKLEEATMRLHAKTKLHDQAVFNSVFAGNWKRLDFRWNLQKNVLVPHRRLELTRQEYRDLIRHPAVIHFTTASKPWLSRCVHPYRRAYAEIYESLFGKLSFPDRTPVSLFKKMCEALAYARAGVLRRLY